MKMDDSRYMNWYWNEATPEEKRLADKISEFGELFGDMLFEPDTTTYELIKCQSKPKDSDVWIDDEVDLPDQLAYFSYTFFLYKIAEQNGSYGYFDPSEQLICVIPEKTEDDIVILHEMIHLHEYVLNDLPMYYHDMVYWALYKDLRNNIPGLDTIITDHAHALNENELYRTGGLHDILFLLKSFDLDIRKSFPLGTVFGYGRADEFKNYKYKDEQQ